jgi:hypothetical protein
MTRGRPGASFGGIVLKSSPPESLTVFRHCRDRTGLRIAEVTVRAGDLVLRQRPPVVRTSSTL